MEAILQGAEPWGMTLGLVWVDCPHPLLSAGLERELKAHTARVHRGRKPPEQAPAVVLCYADDDSDATTRVRRIKATIQEAPVLVLYPYVDAARARAALEEGARGALHVGMPPRQVVRALSVAIEGEVVLPRELLDDLVASERPPDLSTLRPRQIEILQLVVEGFSNAQIAKRLFLSESTIKQHLRGAYKTLGVKNRNQVTRLLSRNDPRRVIRRLPWESEPQRHGGNASGAGI